MNQSQTRPVDVPDHPPWPLGSGEMAGRIRVHDWSQTPLGPIETWPEALRVSVDICLGSAFATYVWWGPDLVQIYNDACRSILCSKHPDSLGRPARDVWPDVWPTVGPMAEQVMRSGKAVRHDDLAMVPDRGGPSEEAFFTFSFSPIRDAGGQIAGMFITAVETTARIRAERAQAAEAERQRRLFESAPGFIAILRGPEHRWEFANQAYNRLFPGRVVVGKRVRDSFPEAAIQEFAAILDRAYATGERFLGEEMPLRLPPAPDAPAQELFLDFVYEPIRDDADRVTGIFVEGYDVTDRVRAEAKLRESEARYRSLFNAIDAGFCVVEMKFDEARRPVDYRFLEVNPAFERHTGLADAEGRWMRSLAPAHEQHWFDIYGAVALTGEPVRFERPAAALDDRWYDVYAFRAGAPDARRVAILFNDISERHRAELALRESEERFRRALEIETVGVIFFDPAGDITWANDAFLGMGGYTREDLEARALRWDLLTPEEWMPASWRAIEEFKTKGVTTPYEKEYYRKDGSRWWALFAAKALGPNEGVEFILDVTKAKEAEAALRASEARFRTLATSIPQLVFRSLDTGERTWGSPQWEVYTGLSDAQSHGFGWIGAVHPDDREATLHAWKRAKGAGEYYAEYRIRRSADGAYRWHQTRAVPIRDPDGRSGEWVGTSADVDDLRQLQEEQRVLVAELQHRTRNLLGVVHSTARQTMRTSASPEAFQAQFYDRLAALSQVQRLLSRSDREPVTIGSLVRLELDALGADMSRDRIMLEGPRVPLRKSSVQTLSLALHELATNARKHGALATERGRLRVTWRIREGDGKGRRLALEWIESGIDRCQEGQHPARRGYGRELIEKALPYQFGAKTTFDLGEDYLRCSIDLPLEKRRKEE